jgi:multiple sugar transport system permease protein
METKNQWKAWIYLAPALILLAIFTFYPFIKTIIISFMGSYNSAGQLSGYNPTSAYGYEFTLRNFYHVSTMKVYIDGVLVDKVVVTGALGSSEFFTALKNTAVIAVITVPGSTIIALLMSVALNSIKPLQKLLQTIYFLPYVTNSIAIGMVFAVMFEVTTASTIDQASTVGVINEFFGLFGIDPKLWVHVSATWGAKMTVACIYGIWNALPFKIMILLGALQSVNKQYYDAAKVDGTSRARTLWRITVPLLSPMIVYVVITGFIGGFKEYTSVVGIFGEGMGPAGANRTMDTMVGLIYNFIEKDQGKASAGALILFGIILVVTLLNLYVSKKKTHY